MRACKDIADCLFNVDIEIRSIFASSLVIHQLRLAARRSAKAAMFIVRACGKAVRAGQGRLYFRLAARQSDKVVPSER